MTVLMVEALLTTIQAIPGAIPRVAAALRVEVAVVAGATDQQQKREFLSQTMAKGVPPFSLA